MPLQIRNVSSDDFNSIYPLLQQLWPGKALDIAQLHTVLQRGVSSQMDTLLCAVLGRKDDRVLRLCDCE